MGTLSLVRLTEEEDTPPARVVLDLRSSRESTLRASGPAGTWTHRLSPRHAKMSRMRRHFGGILLGRPYRFADDVEVVVERPADGGDVLPYSLAPAVRG